MEQKDAAVLGGTPSRTLSTGSQGWLEGLVKVLFRGLASRLLIQFPSLPSKGLELEPDNGLICHVWSSSLSISEPRHWHLLTLETRDFGRVPHAEVHELVRGKAGNQSESMLVTPPAILATYPRRRPPEASPAHPSRCSAFGEPVSRSLCWTGMHTLDKPPTVGKSATSPQLPC